jgi:predicted DNA-binding transcriptional regulator AlpA
MPWQQPTDDELLTSTQAAEIAGLHRTHFARLVADGKGPKHQKLKTPKRHLVVIRRGDLTAWLAGRNG